MAYFQFKQIVGSEMTMEPATVTIKYRAEGAPESFSGDFFDWIASYALLVIPRTYLHPLGLLYLQDIHIVENWYAKEYLITAPYGRTPGQNEPGAYSITVDQIGGTVHVTAGTRIAGFGPTENEVDNGGLIGVDGDEVHGTDIPVEESKITIRYRHPGGILNAAYIKAVGRLVGFPNADSFLTYEPGEVLYLGGNFSESEAEATASYSFAISYNRTGFEVGGILVDKAGWDVLSLYFIEDDTTENPTKKVGYIEVVRPAGREWKNYRTTFGWGGT